MYKSWCQSTKSTSSGNLSIANIEPPNMLLLAARQISANIYASHVCRKYDKRAREVNFVQVHPTRLYPLSEATLSQAAKKVIFNSFWNKSARCSSNQMNWPIQDVFQVPKHGWAGPNGDCKVWRGESNWGRRFPWHVWVKLVHPAQVVRWGAQGGSEGGADQNTSR